MVENEHPGRRAGFSRRSWLSLVLVAAVISAAVSAGVTEAVTGGANKTIVERFTSNTSLIKEQPTDIQAILAKVLPSVVSIKATVAVPPSGYPLFPFPSLFGGGLFGGTGGQAIDEGTGMVITPTGEVLTNNHVIAGATSITVSLNGRSRPLPATVVGADPADDMALLQIKGVTGLPTVQFGNSSKIVVGDDVLAIGNALGLAGGPTVTDGIISAEGRTVQASDPTTGQTETLTDMFQTNAAINPGNSGGPLVDSSAQVIGMNTAVAQGTGSGTQAQNIGFAIPANKIDALLGLLRKGGTVSPAKAFLGVQVFSLTPSFRSEYGLTPTSGAVVAQIVPGSPAAASGILPGDVIVSVDAHGVTSAESLTSAVRSHKPGQRLTIVYYRGSHRRSVSVVLGQTPTS